MPDLTAIATEPVQPSPPAAPVNPKDHTVAHLDPHRQRVWDLVAASPIHNLWDFQGTPPWTIFQRG
jgi:hypothetical protein